MGGGESVPPHVGAHARPRRGMMSGGGAGWRGAAQRALDASASMHQMIHFDAVPEQGPSLAGLLGSIYPKLAS